MEVLKILFLFLAVWMSIVNISRLVCKNRIPWVNFILQSVGIVGFLYLQFMR